MHVSQVAVLLQKCILLVEHNSNYYIDTCVLNTEKYVTPKIDMNLHRDLSGVFFHILTSFLIN